jgi:hypothetical protein
LIAVELAPDVSAALRAMKDRGTPPPRCHSGVIKSVIAGVVRRRVDTICLESCARGICRSCNGGIGC